jgi:hypothetical protein
VTPEVTVVVPTHNRADILGLTLRTVLAQRGVDLHVVVVDEASTDHTATVIEGLGDERVEVVRNATPRGTAGARNAGLEVVSTPWVAFCDDDDLWSPDKLSAQLAAVDATHRWCCAGTVFVDEELRILDHQRCMSGDVLDDLLQMNQVPGGGSGVLVDTELLRSVGAFDEALRNSEDWDCWIRLAQRSPLAAVDRPLVAYRIWPGSLSRDMGRMELAWEAITSRHAALASTRGVTPDRWGHQRYLARQQVRSRRRVAAARGYTQVALHGGDRRQLVRAAAAMVAPGVMDRIGTERAMRRVPRRWRAEADAWLDEHRQVALVLDTGS